MYTLIDVFYRKSPHSADIVALNKDVSDFATQRLVDIFNNYAFVYMVLENSYHTTPDGDPIPMGVDLTAMRSTLASKTDTLAEWLNLLGNTALPKDDELRVLVRKEATYMDHSKLGYRLYRTYADAHPNSDYPLEDRRNLLITRDDHDYEWVMDNTLVTLNGILHRSRHTAHGVCVDKAVDTLEIGNVDTVGFINFEALGGVTQLVIPSDQLKQDGNDNPLHTRIAIDFDQPIEPGTWGVVFMGRLYTGDFVRFAHDKRLIFDTSQVDFANVYQYLREKIDLSMLELNDTRSGGDAAFLDDFKTDANIRAMWDAQQSFLVKIGNDHVTGLHKPVSVGKVAGRFFTEVEPKELLIDSRGYFRDYWVHHDWGTWVINATPTWDVPYLHDRTDRQQKVASVPQYEFIHPARPEVCGLFTYYRDDMETPQ